MGLAERLVDDATAEAERLARRLAKLSAPALAAILRSVAAADGPLEAGMELERREIVGLFEGDDAREGPRGVPREAHAGLRLAHLALEPGPVRLAQLALEDLPRAGLRQRLVAELDRARQLVAGDAARGSASISSSSAALALAQHDGGVHALAPVLVRHAEDRGLEHRGVVVERFSTSAE